MNQLLRELKEAIPGELVKKNSGECSSKESRGEKEKKAENLDFEPLVLKRTVCYIVSAVIIEEGRILMMKEAKKSCRGLWYLPAGRLEANESFAEGVKREVLEETGLTFEPTSLICVEVLFSSMNWFRLTFTGKITGGRLKTIHDEDKESIEAGWFPASEVFLKLPLRARDICPLIEATIKWKETIEKNPIFTSMPVAIPHSRVTIRVVLVSNSRNGMEILLDKENCMGFLECTPCHVSNSVQEVVEYIVSQAQSTSQLNYQLNGIISIEHVGKPHGVADGICITLLAEAKSQFSVKNRYEWWDVRDENLRYKISQLLLNGCIQIIKN